MGQWIYLYGSRSLTAQSQKGRTRLKIRPQDAFMARNLDPIAKFVHFLGITKMSPPPIRNYSHMSAIYFDRVLGALRTRMSANVELLISGILFFNWAILQKNFQTEKKIFSRWSWSALSPFCWSPWRLWRRWRHSSPKTTPESLSTPSTGFSATPEMRKWSPGVRVKKIFFVSDVW